ncbi:putative membrane protein [Pseudomonas sp. CCOS 191]|nr:putative membrane protein [Pseudomonas sp. CCOS 191]
MSNLQIGLMIVTVIVVFALVNFYLDYLRDRD